MGHCLSKSTSTVNTDAVIPVAASDRRPTSSTPSHHHTPSESNTNGVTTSSTTNSAKTTPARSHAASPCPSPYPAGIMPSPSPARSTPRRFWPFPPPSPAKPILTMLRRRGTKQQNKQGTIAEDGEEVVGVGGGGGNGSEGGATLDKTFDYARNFGARFELGKEVGRGHFGHTCLGKGKKGELKGQPVAVKIISKDKV